MDFSFEHSTLYQGWWRLHNSKIIAVISAKNLSTELTLYDGQVERQIYFPQKHLHNTCLENTCLNTWRNTMYLCFAWQAHSFPHSMLALNWSPPLAGHIHAPRLFISLFILTLLTQPTVTIPTISINSYTNHSHWAKIQCQPLP